MDWLKSRLLERTSMDGAVIVVAVLALLILGPNDIAAYAGLAYGIWTFAKSEASK
jgi:hypothetical protein